MNPSPISEASFNEETINNIPHNDIESANEALSGSNDWEHIQDFAMPISLGGLGASITLIAIMPSNATAHPSLYTGYNVAAFNGLFAALALAFYACRRRRSRQEAWMLKRLIFLTLTFIAIACLLLPVFALPLQYLGIQFLFIFAVIILVVVYLYITSDCKRRGGTDAGVGDGDTALEIHN